MTVLAGITIRAWNVSVIRHQMPRQSSFMFPRRTITARLRARGVHGACPASREPVGPSAIQGKRGAFWRDAKI